MLFLSEMLSKPLGNELHLLPTNIGRHRKCCPSAPRFQNSMQLCWLSPEAALLRGCRLSQGKAAAQTGRPSPSDQRLLFPKGEPAALPRHQRCQICHTSRVQAESRTSSSWLVLAQPTRGLREENSPGLSRVRPLLPGEPTVQALLRQPFFASSSVDVGLLNIYRSPSLLAKVVRL